MKIVKREIIYDCHYCKHACCCDEDSAVDCYKEESFDHKVEDSKEEAEGCPWFSFSDRFPKL